MLFKACYNFCNFHLKGVTLKGGFGLGAGLCIVILLAFYPHKALAQASMSCAAMHQSQGTASKASALTPGTELYDVHYVKLDISLTNQSVAIAGAVTTVARLGAVATDQYVFELDKQFMIDSVTINGVQGLVMGNDYVRTVRLPAQLPANTVFTARVYYHGAPVAGNGYFRAGLNNVAAEPWGIKATYTLSEPFMAREWWPCKQMLTDKIDSADIWITVPKGLKAGSNGLLKKITTVTDSTERYEWKTNYPIDYYLLSAAVAPYRDYSFKVAIDGLKDSLLVQNYIYDNDEAFTKYKNGIDSTAQMLQYFSGIFGAYPFHKEKYGHCIVPLPGGMEHQTMTTLGDFGPLLVAHELAHQWFGDHVTCRSWKDIWLNESFASYAEHLFVEKFYGSNAADEHIRSVQDIVLKDSNVTGSVYVASDTDNLYRIFDSRLSYNKGSCVLHTLRFVIDNDSIFFAIMKKYQQQFAMSTAATEDFIKIAEQLSGRDLSVFFKQWIYGEGYPIYMTKWNQAKDEVFIELEQTTTVRTSVPLFITPLEIKLQSPQGDTVIRVMNELLLQHYRLNWHNTLTGIVIDPYNKLLNTEKYNIHDPSLGLNSLSLNDILVYPSPANNYWSVAGLEKGADVLLADMDGHIVWRQKRINTTGIVIPAQQLASGMYILYQVTGNNKPLSVKLIKN